MIHVAGGVRRLIGMLDLTLPELPAMTSAVKMAMQEQAAATLADLAHDSYDMQEAIVDAGAVPPLLAFIRIGSPAGQEQAARAVWHLAEFNEHQPPIVSAGAVSDLVQLLKTGSAKAQEMAAAGLTDLARGGIDERAKREARRRETGRRAKRISITLSTNDVYYGLVGMVDEDDLLPAATRWRPPAPAGGDAWEGDGAAAAQQHAAAAAAVRRQRSRGVVSAAAAASAEQDMDGSSPRLVADLQAQAAQQPRGHRL